MSQITSFGIGIIPPGLLVETLTGNSGGAVGPDGANNIFVVGDGTTIDVAGNPGTNTLTISTISNSTAFSAHLSATQSSVTGDGTTYQVPYNATYFNNGSVFNTGTNKFVAPEAGEYCFSVTMILADVGAAHTQGQVDLNVNSGGAIHTILDWNASAVGDVNGAVALNGFRILSLNANDTVGVQLTVSNSTKTVDINGGASSDCVFEGFLVTSLGGQGNLQFDGDTGSANPSAGIINIVGNGVNISTSAAGNTVTINDSTGFEWNNITVVGPTAMVVQNGYVANNAGLVGLDLPTTSVFGDTIKIAGLGSGGWIINQAAGQSIIVGSQTSTVGALGSVASTNAHDGVSLLCVVANTTWLALDGIGTLTVT